MCDDTERTRRYEREDAAVKAALLAVLDADDCNRAMTVITVDVLQQILLTAVPAVLAFADAERDQPVLRDVQMSEATRAALNRLNEFQGRMLRK